jgi:hypothetical protein
MRTPIGRLAGCAAAALLAAACQGGPLPLASDSLPPARIVRHGPAPAREAPRRMPPQEAPAHDRRADLRAFGLAERREGGPGRGGPVVTDEMIARVDRAVLLRQAGRAPPIEDRSAAAMVRRVPLPETYGRGGDAPNLLAIALALLKHLSR